MLFIALFEIVTFSFVHDIFCFANFLDPDQAPQNEGPDQNPDHIPEKSF